MDTEHNKTPKNNAPVYRVPIFCDEESLLGSEGTVPDNFFDQLNQDQDLHDDSYYGYDGYDDEDDDDDYSDEEFE